MPQVTIAINGRPYAIACDSGEEDRIRQLAKAIDARVSAFAKDAPQAGESRLLLMAALMLADEVSDTKESLRRVKAGPVAASPNEEAALASGIDRLAQRIETVAARLEASHI